MLLIDHIGKRNDIMVSVICATYNHAPYIKKTIESFINQKTTFPFEIIIHDDASTDGTQDIIKEYAKKYPDKIRAMLQRENQYSQGKIISINYIHPLVNGKYIAICEGDDYWPELNKLQQQYLFLENHSEYSAVGGITRYFNDDEQEIISPLPAERFVNRDAQEKNYLNIPEANIASNTLMYHAKYVFDQDYIAARKESPKVGDILLLLKLFEMGKIYIFGVVYQNHRIQTRNNASNYNSIHSEKEKIIDSTNVYNAVFTHYSKKHDLGVWLGYQLTVYLIYCFRNRELKAWFQVYVKIKNRRKIITIVSRMLLKRILMRLFR